MNLREIKKDIDYIFSAFVEDCCYVAAQNSKLTGEKANELIDEAVEIYNSLRDKAARLGFKRIYVSAYSAIEAKTPSGITVVKLRDVPELVKALFK